MNYDLNFRLTNSFEERKYDNAEHDYFIFKYGHLCEKQEDDTYCPLKYW